MDEIALRCTGLHKTYGSTRALDGFDLTVRCGDVMALLGPSGCGKTTALRVIAGFEAPDAGTVEIAGRRVAGDRVRVPPEKRNVGLVFQDYALFPHMSVAGNVAYGLKRGHPKGRLAELLELAGLQGLEARMPHQLSGGQQQRVALARTLAAEPELILLDEPFSNLDPSVRARVRAEVKELIRSTGVTAVFVTHDQEEALSLAESVAVMMEGRVLQVGSPAEVYDRPVTRAIAEFVGDANFLSGRVQNSVVECEIGRFPVQAPFDGAADVMVRAEALALSEAGHHARVCSTEYYGHDQMVTVRLDSGTILKVRLLTAAELRPGQEVGVEVRGPVFAYQRS